MKKIISLLIPLICLNPVYAGPLTFGFTNPSFGGNPFNSNHFLSMAESQKIPKEKEVVKSTVEQFQEQLQSRILSALSSQITQQIYDGEFKNGQPVKVGDIVITPRVLGEKLTLEILQGGVLTEFSLDAPGATNTVN